MMEPIPETLEAIAELGPEIDDGTFLERLLEMGSSVQTVAPDCVGISVASRRPGVTFTLVATSEEAAALDAVQYLCSGPCVEAVETDEGIATTGDDLMSEPRWQADAQATAAAGVRSTLTFPILEDGTATGSVNLYGSSAAAFDGKHQRLAAVLGAWTPGAVSNADLSFSTRMAATRAPEQLRTRARVDVATGIVAALRGVDVTSAEELMLDAARRAGISLPTLAEAIIHLRNS
jgi:GAF domain-containing protein